MALIETHHGECDDDLRVVADGILQTLNPENPNWWHPYELRGKYRYGGKTFREFFCIAGSVQIWLWKLAAESRVREVVMLEDDAAAGPAI
jgi:hypothetical protein